MDKKKIGHVTFDMRIGGAEQVILNLALNTDPERYDVTIICIEKEIGPLGNQIKGSHVDIVSFGRTPGFDVNLIRQIRSFVVENKIDLLHCHQYTPYVYGLFSSFFLPCEVIFTEHGRFFPDQRKIKRALINPVLGKFTKAITAISSATVEALVQYENFRKSKIELVYNGLDDSIYRKPDSYAFKKKYAIAEDTFILGTVARLDPIKNQKMMIRSVKDLVEKNENVTLIVVGDGPERETLEQYAEHLGVTNNVLFTGFRTDVHHFYPWMDVFLLTSFSEGTAMTLLESMACSVPCIVTDVGGNPEIVEAGKTGFVIPSGDHKSLTASVQKLIHNPDRRKQFGIASRKRFENKFTINKMVEAYQDLYDR